MMDKDIAEAKADHWIDLILTHQGGLFSDVNANAAGGAAIAETVAGLRKELVAQLQKQ